jgi:beta-carotene hydroxylase
MLASEASKPLTIPPKELLTPPSGFSPTLLLFLVIVAILVLSGFGYWLWEWPHWLCFSVNTLAMHLSATVIHDACHQCAHRNRVVNAILGHGSALVTALAFPVFSRVHLQHHGHVNHPKNDPDHYVSTGGPIWLSPVRFLYHEVFFFQRRLWKKYELVEWFLSRLIWVAVFAIAIKYQFLGYILNFWFIPNFIVGIELGLFLDYLPHRPFVESDRWKNTRVYPNQFLNLLIFGQNYHLIHHLWPAIPWYHYQDAYYVMKPLLDEKGCYQNSGIFEGSQFWRFLYDFFVGIRFDRHHE